MPISPEAKKIADKIYTVYGSDSGHLFGLVPGERYSVEAIVQATIEMVTEHLTKLKEKR